MNCKILQITILFFKKVSVDMKKAQTQHTTYNLQPPTVAGSSTIIT